MAYAKKTWALDDPITDVALNNIETGVDTAHDVLDATGTPTGLSAATANAIGTATAKAKADHTHTILANGTPSTQAMGDTAVVGTSAHLARADHKHAMPAFGYGATNVLKGSLIQAGNVGNASRAQNTRIAVTFPRAFASAPRVVVSLNENCDDVTILVGNITTTGFTVRNPYQAGVVGFNWIAVLDPSQP